MDGPFMSIFILICGECSIPDRWPKNFKRLESEARCPLCHSFYCSNRRCLKRLTVDPSGATFQCPGCKTEHHCEGQGDGLISAEGPAV